MVHVKSDSDVTSIGCTSSSSSPAPPKRHQPSYYYVQSPSRDSHDDTDNKSSTNTQTTPTYTSPMESPSHPSQSWPSSASRVSGPWTPFRKGSHYHHIGRKRNQQQSHKGWPPRFGAIDEEGGDDFNGEQIMRRCRIMLALMGFVMIFTVICLITWGASRPFKVGVEMKSWRVNNFYYGEGSDYTGVPTKLLTINCTVKMNIHNPATFFGIHISSTSLDLFFSRILVASGQLKKYYQPKKSERTLSVNLEGLRVPLYGAGAGLAMSSDNGSVPLRLEFEIRSRADLVGKLVKTKRRRQVLCAIDVDSQSTKINKFKQNSCKYV